jgi:hypothetical protein
MLFLTFRQALLSLTVSKLSADAGIHWNEICQTSLNVSLPFAWITGHAMYPSVCRFKSQPYTRHLTEGPSFGGQIAEARRGRRRQLSALQTMDPPLDGAKYGWLLNLQTLEMVQKRAHVNK